ncbi:MAG: hypothetical protein LBP43_03000 [Treponema sp.]|jgi:hypothetical protein|nr:hypothetical protein [Treponema sp.]
MNNKNSLFLFPVLIMVITLFSCSARITGAVKEDSSAEFALRVSLENRMTALIRSLSALSGSSPAASQDNPVIDGPAIGRSMAAAPGLASVSLRNDGPAAVEGEILISRIGDFLSLPESRGGKRFITYTPSPGRLTITLDRSSGPGIMALISPEVTDYLSAFMAPVVTGEVLSQGEYLDLVASLYGRTLADEIAAARIYASVDFPGPLQSVRGGTFSGRRAEFAVPLVDLLVLENPLEYEVRWQGLN